MLKRIKKIMKIGLVLSLALIIYLFWSWFSPQVEKDTVVIIEQGSSFRKLARSLDNKGIITQFRTFIMLAQVRGDTRNIHMGEYNLKKGMSQSEILSLFVSGRVITYPLTLLEGWNFSQFREILKKSSKLKQTVAGLSNQEIMAKLGRNDLHPEGYFYPDTYFYSTGSTDFTILKNAFEKMQSRLDQQWQSREKGLPYKSKYEALIMASIVEKETGQASERPIIAGVFINRLRIGMRLQTDPTVIYGMGNSFKGNIRKKDLRKDTPYNTYTRGGLPPTPIAMPGDDAIYAALHPAKTDALYFVARGDGSHVFSKTLTDHNKAVREFQLKKK